MPDKPAPVDQARPKTLMPGDEPVPPAPVKKGLFGSKPAPGPGPEVAGLNEQINNLAARVRISEQRFNDLRKKIQFIEQNMLGNHKKAMGDIKDLTGEIDDVKHSISEIEDRIITVIKELRLTARKEDIAVLKRYIELWDPLKFVTADQAEKIARELMEGRKMSASQMRQEEGENI